MGKRVAAMTPEEREKAKARNAAWYAANTEKAKAKHHAWRAANAEKAKAKDAAYRAANRENMRAENRAWRAANREKVNAQSRAQRAANPEKKRAQERARYAANPEKRKAQARVYAAANREKVKARKTAYLRGNFLAWAKEILKHKKKGQKYIDCTPTQVAALRSRYMRCPVCDVYPGKERRTRPSLDRIIPSLGYIPGNVVLICVRCNAIKQDATAAEIQRVADYTLQATQQAEAALAARLLA